MSNANVIQVRQEVTHFEMFLLVEVKDEKKKLGEFKADLQPKMVRRLRFSWACTKHEEMGLLLLNPANYRQSSNTKEDVKKLLTIAEVANNVPYNITDDYRNGRIEN